MKLRTHLIINTLFVIILFILSYGIIIKELQKVLKVQQLSGSARKLRITGRDFQIATDRIFLERNQFTVLMKNWNETSDQFNEELKKLLDLGSSLKLPDLVKTSLASLSDSAEVQNNYRIPFEKSAEEILKQSDLSAKVQYTGLHGYFLTRSPDENPRWLPLLKDLETNMELVGKGYNTMNNSLTTLSDRLDSYLMNLIKKGVIYMTSLVLLITLFSVGYVFIFSHMLSNSFIKLETSMEMLSARDLTNDSSVRGSKEMKALGNHINDVRGSFIDFIKEVNHVTNQTICLQDTLAAGTADTLTSLQQITKNIESLEKTILSMEGDTKITDESVQVISEQIRNLNENINSQYALIQSNLSANEQISSSIVSINRLVEMGNDKSKSMVSKLADGEELAELSHTIITRVAQTIREVLDVTGIINDISDQTSILSMNAAIESAHAGEAGKGFAVVAEEIRNLAESTAENSHHIDEILKKVTQQIDEALKASTESYTSVGYLKTGLNDLSDSLTEINQGMEELSKASGEMVKSSQELNSVTLSITDSSGRINSKANAIGQVVATMKSGTEYVALSINEIGGGSREIIRTMKEVHNMSEDNKEGMSRLDSIVGSYRIEDQEARECSDDPSLLPEPEQKS